jgi:precorrin-6B methylase 2
MQRRTSTTSLVVWEPTPYEIVQQMLTLAQVSPGDVVYDLGCGDGRVLVTAVKDFGAERAVGYELRQDLCETSRKAIGQLDLPGRIRIVNGDLRKAYLSQASVVTLYLTTKANRMLARQLEGKLRPGTRVVTYLFPVPGWLPASEIDLQTLSFKEGRFIGKLYLYIIPQAFADIRANRK